MNEIILETKNSQELNKALQLYRKTKDQDIIAKLYTPYIPLIFGLCMKYYKNEEDSKDAVNSIYELIHQKLKTQHVHHFHSWIYVVSKNYVLQQIRNSKQTKYKESEAIDMYYESLLHPDIEMNKEEKINHLEECLKKLNTVQAECINRFYFQKQSYSNISEELKMDWNSVRSNIQNGRRNLKVCMEKK